MAFKFIVFASFLVAANAGLLATPQFQYAPAPVAYAAKVATPVIAKTVVQEEYDPHPQYSYGYDVQDSLTGDNKEQHEQRDGDVVTGSYALNDPDGYRRIVDYTSDPVHGFNAHVRREPLGAPLVAKVATAPAAIVTKTLATPVSYAAPAPIAYSAPVAKLAYAAPAYAAPTFIHH